MHGDPAPQEGFGRLQLWASFPPLLVAELHEGLACLQAEGLAALALSGPGGAKRPWGRNPDLYVHPTPLKGPMLGLPTAPQPVSGPRDPWEAVGVYKGGSRHHSPGLGLGSPGEALPCP